MSLLAKSIFMFLFGAFASSANLEKHFESKEICSQGLAQCNVTAENSLIRPDDFGPIEGVTLNVRPAFCCKTNKKCRACVVVKIQFKIFLSSSEDKNRAAAVLLRYTSGSNIYHRRISFVVTNKAHEQESIEVVEYDIAFLGTSVNVSGVQNGVLSKLKSQSVFFPKLDEVCPASDIEECNICSDTDRKEYNISRFFADVNQNKGVVTFKGDGESQLLTCMRRQPNGTCWKSRLTLPLHSVTPCMCFQVWKNSCFRTEICPFKHNHTDLRENVLKEMNISVVHFVTSAGQRALRWNLKSPCSQEAEVLLYRKNSGWWACCEEVQRITINNKSVWDENSSTMWTEGVFTNLSSSDLFVMYKVDGKMFGPACQCTDSFTLLLIIFILLMLMLIMGTVTAYMLQSRIKGWILKQAYQSPEQRGEVLLVHASTSDPSLSKLACRFGSLLSELGFSVALDLWEPTSVSAMGPTPWLHSQLQRITKQGGKTLLLLSPDALCQAKAFWESGNGETSSSWSADVFGSLLTSIYSTRRNGGVAERFALVQFDSETFDMPELFRGLRLYQLPSESRSFLTDLYVGGLKRTRLQLKRFIWIYKASMKLQQGLNGHHEEYEEFLYNGTPA